MRRRSHALTEYGKRVKIAQIAQDISTAQLAVLVSNDTGMYCSTPYLSRILTGQRNPEKIKASINKILQLEDITDIVQ